MPSNNNPTPFEESLLTLRFIGDELESRSVPIYELGISLVAIQRVVNKAYLFNQGRLDKAARPSEDERGEVALQIGSRKKASDGYGLIPILETSVAAPLIVAAIKEGVSAIWAYARRDVNRVPHDEHSGSATNSEEQPENQALVAAIYPEVRQLTERVGGSGKVSSLEISPKRVVGAKPVVLEAQTKEYVREIERGDVLGPKTTIQGFVRSLSLELRIVEIRTQGKSIKIRLEKENFLKLQQLASLERLVSFTGRPVFRIGEITARFKEFVADSFAIAAR